MNYKLSLELRQMKENDSYGSAIVDLDFILKTANEKEVDDEKQRLFAVVHNIIDLVKAIEQMELEKPAERNLVRYEAMPDMRVRIMPKSKIVPVIPAKKKTKKKA